MLPATLTGIPGYCVGALCGCDSIEVRVISRKLGVANVNVLRALCQAVSQQITGEE